MTSALFVDVAFPLRGRSIALDHGYALFGAVSRLVPQLHQEPIWAIHPVHGKRVGPGVLQLLPGSLLTIRVPTTSIGELLPLSGHTLDVLGDAVSTGIPRIFPLKPRPALRSRFVTVKSFQEEGSAFVGALKRQLATLGVSETASVVAGTRRVQRVSKHIIVGFPVDIDGLSADESVRLQTSGLGGRRHMGAGVFLPPSDAE